VVRKEREKEGRRMRKLVVVLVSMVALIGYMVAKSPVVFAEGVDPLINIQIVPPDPSLPDEIKFFSGRWEGTWMGDKAASRSTAKLIISEVGKEEVVATTARESLIVSNKVKAKIKRQNDGRLYIEMPPTPAGTSVYIAYPEKGELKGTAQGRYSTIEATLKKKQ
jgi:hypothetical protein